MALVLRSACDDAILPSTCENPQFPSWAWRYNRNKHLSRFEPWYIREERMPPNYRNMGVHSNFRFHPVSPSETPRPFQALAVNFCHDLNKDRVAGFGNSAIGRGPGPAPPRLIMYDVSAPFPSDDFYRVNEIHDISNGVSLLGPTPIGMLQRDGAKTVPLNPSHYLDQTLGQTVQIPGSFPHFNKSLPPLAHNQNRECPLNRDAPLNLMEVWQKNYARQQANHLRPGHYPLSRSYSAADATRRKAFPRTEAYFSSRLMC